MVSYSPRVLYIKDYMLNLAQPILQPIASQYAPGEDYHKRPIYAIPEGDMLRVLTQSAKLVAKAKK
jgi:hypothetical protein